jgi:preflagellin peptidase FlaK
MLWKIRLWGGGDVKLITAISSVLPIQPFLINHQTLFSIYRVDFPVIAIYPFPLTIIFNSILISFPFLVLFILINYFNNNHFKNHPKNYFNNNHFKNHFKNYFKNHFKHDFKYYKHEFNVNMENSCKFYFKNIINFKKRVFLDNIMDKQLKSYNKVLKMIIFIFIYVFLVFLLSRFGIIKSDNLFYVVLFGVFFSLVSKFTSKILLKFKKIVKNGSKKQIKIEYLKEGMIVDKLLINSFNSNNITSDVNLEYFLIKFNLKNEKSFYNISFKKNKNNYILTSKTAAGLSKQDLILIKKLFNNNMISNTLYIKLGLPFAPSIFIGLIFSIFI